MIGGPSTALAMGRRHLRWALASAVSNIEPPMTTNRHTSRLFNMAWVPQQGWRELTTSARQPPAIPYAYVDHLP